MSVTFYVTIMEGDEICRHLCPQPLTCDEGGRYCYHAFELRMDCDTCNEGVQMANSNARLVLERLGLDTDDLIGTINPDDLLGRAMTANVGRDDSGVRSISYQPRPGGMHIIEGGLPEGYFEDTFTRLSELAMKAKQRGRSITYC